jgi:hypothetical protein
MDLRTLKHILIFQCLIYYLVLKQATVLKYQMVLPLIQTYTVTIQRRHLVQFFVHRWWIFPDSCVSTHSHHWPPPPTTPHHYW